MPRAREGFREEEPNTASTLDPGGATMRNRTFRSLAVVAVAACTILATSASSAVVDPAIPTGVITGLTSPESVTWDAATNAWYISVGAFGGEGGVMKLPAGSDTPEPFVTGLGGPQGVTIHDGTMYVADGDHVQVIDMANPATQSSIPTGGGASDVDVDPASGDLFVSDLGGGRVWRISGETSTEFATINQPDGLYVKDGGVFIANFGIGAPGGIFRFDIGTGAQTTVSEIPLATLDGLEPDGDDWLTTDFSKGHFWRVAPDGSLTLLGQLLPGTADIGFDPVTRTVGVPNLLLGFVVFYTV